MHKKHEVNPVITWNTMCMYSEHGQRMAAVLHEDMICYMDFDRGLEGSFRARRFEYSTDDISEAVEFLYTRNLGENDMPPEAHERLKAHKDLVDSATRAESFGSRRRRTNPVTWKEVPDGTV